MNKVIRISFFLLTLFLQNELWSAGQSISDGELTEVAEQAVPEEQAIPDDGSQEAEFASVDSNNDGAESGGGISLTCDISNLGTLISNMLIKNPDVKMNSWGGVVKNIGTCNHVTVHWINNESELKVNRIELQYPEVDNVQGPSAKECKQFYDMLKQFSKQQNPDVEQKIDLQDACKF